MLYIVARLILKAFFKICFRLKIFGRENFPASGALIVASNHVSFLDPVIVGIGAPRKMNFLARDSLFRIRLFSRILNMINTFPIKREGGDIGAFRLSLDKLSEGKVMFLFPEGTRSADGTLQNPRYGIGLLQALSGVDILPCYIKGSKDALPRYSNFPKFKAISVHFGKVLKFDRGFPGAKKERYIDTTVKVMSAIAELKKNAD